MSLRVLQVQDADMIASLWLRGAAESAQTDSAYQPQISLTEYAAILRDNLQNGDNLGWGLFAEEDGQLLAYLTAQVRYPEQEFSQQPYLCLLDLDVHVAACRQGCAARLVSAAKVHAQQHQLSHIEVSWLSADPQAAAFWASQRATSFLSRGRIHTA
ncbi:GNAT family N-acetyltransferase [Undibacterium oligocarboniphilum]|uniref:N-acetyltransferase domain-containing protein n=1 Tax=Undibacterium oligocarboniphilum TaxID=666702 RepID=A0A850QEY1_9BURK|nr:GNAT family N-acetyltransferase [Undibacterium oligocarboniphilum]MBC3869370.1 hypothetical protein [Undibacterium oligocarboniphilum]NVO77749.1 hypothetical protein [Undibacterium oligocarboniphilum]